MNLLDYLIKSGYDKPISQKILTAPSSKDFQLIFKFLFSKIDPTVDFDKKFEDEVPVLLKGIKYPFANEISKSQLYAVGSMHAWPGLLAMLSWLVDLIHVYEAFEDAGNDSDPIDDPEGIFFDYLCKSYKIFLAGGDDYDDLIKDMSSCFGICNFELNNCIDVKNERILNDIEERAIRIEALNTEYNSLIGDISPLEKVEKDKLTYSQDIEKFSKFIEHLHLRKSKFIENISRLEEEINIAGKAVLLIIENELKTIDDARADLQRQIDAQDISPEDIDRMNSEKELLSKNLESLIAAKEEASKIFWDKELAAQKQLDIVEKLLLEYSQAVERINKTILDACGIDISQLLISMKSSLSSSYDEPLIDKNIEQDIMVQSKRFH